jgi:DNA-binding Lrp family transcriptional regulator
MKNRILDLLRQNARLSSADIALRLDTDEATVENVIGELESSRTILGYHAVTNPEKLDDEPCIGIIEVRLTPQRKVGYNEIASQIYKFPEVKLCYLVSGAYDLLVFVESANLKEVASFVNEKLATIENVTSTATHFILRKYKEGGMIVDEEDKVDRLSITP